MATTFVTTTSVVPINDPAPTAIVVVTETGVIATSGVAISVAGNDASVTLDGDLVVSIGIVSGGDVFLAPNSVWSANIVIDEAGSINSNGTGALVYGGDTTITNDGLISSRFSTGIEVYGASNSVTNTGSIIASTSGI